MLTLTPEAIRAVVDVVVAQESRPRAGLRISPGPHSAFEPTWDYAVEREPREDDVVIEEGPAQVFVDPDAVPLLEHAVLDAQIDDDTLEVRFVVRQS